MNKFFASPKFWGVYSIVYFVLMMIACVIAEGHVTGGGGESDVTVWAFDWQGWNSMNTADTFKMFCFLIIQMLPWLLAIIAPPKGKIYSVLLLLHLIIGLLLAIIYVGEVVYGLTADIDAHFKDWDGSGIYPSPIDKYTNTLLLYFCGPILFIYDVIVAITGFIDNICVGNR